MTTSGLYVYISSIFLYACTITFIHIHTHERIYTLYFSAYTDTTNVLLSTCIHENFEWEPKNFTCRMKNGECTSVEQSNDERNWFCACVAAKKKKIGKWDENGTKKKSEKKNHWTNEQRNIYILRRSPYVTNTYVVPWHWAAEACITEGKANTPISSQQIYREKHSTRLLLLLMVLCSVLLVIGTADVVIYI